MTYDRKFFDWLVGYRRDLLGGEFRVKLVDYLVEREYQSLIELTPEEVKQTIRHDGFCPPINDYSLDELIMEVPLAALAKVFYECVKLKARAKELFQDFKDYNDSVSFNIGNDNGLN